MHNRRPRTFRRRSDGRDFRRHNHDHEGKSLISGSFSNVRGKNNFQSHQSVGKLLERYKILAKEAFSTGDKILSENYLQHADHFERIISHKNLNQNESSSQVVNVVKEQNNNLSKNSSIDQDPASKNKE